MAQQRERFRTVYRDCQIAVDHEQQDDGRWRAWWEALCGGDRLHNAPRTEVRGRFDDVEAAKDAGLSEAKKWIDKLKG